MELVSWFAVVVIAPEPQRGERGTVRQEMVVLAAKLGHRAPRDNLGGVALAARRKGGVVIHPSTNAVKVEISDEVGRIRLLGEIDHTAVEQLDRAVADVLDHGVDLLEVDFADLSFFDSACISALVRARAQAEERGGTIRLVNVNRYARRILDLTGLASVFAIDES